MNKATKIAIVVVGALLVIPPYIAAMIVLFGGHLNSDQVNMAGSIGGLGIFYWFIVGMVALWMEG